MTTRTGKTMWHINEETGETGECKPFKTGVCGLKASASDHFDTQEEAREAYEFKQKVIHGATVSMSKKEKKETAQRIRHEQDKELSRLDYITPTGFLKHYSEDELLSGRSDSILAAEAAYDEVQNYEVNNAVDAYNQSLLAEKYRISLATTAAIEREMKHRNIDFTPLDADFDNSEGRDLLPEVFATRFAGNTDFATITSADVETLDDQELREEYSRHIVAADVLENLGAYRKKLDWTSAKATEFAESRQMPGVAEISRNNALIIDEEMLRRGLDTNRISPEKWVQSCVSRIHEKPKKGMEQSYYNIERVPLVNEIPGKERNVETEDLDALIQSAFQLKVYGSADDAEKGQK